MFIAATAAASSTQALSSHPAQAHPAQANSYNLQVEWQSDGAVLLTWDAPSNADSSAYYRARRKTDAAGQGYSVIVRKVRDDDGDGRLSYLDESAELSQEQSYLYGVRAFNIGGKKRGKWTKGVRLDPPASHANAPARRAKRVAPVFTDPVYRFNIPENSPIGASVGTVPATDADGDAITYSIEDHPQHSGDSSHFAVDSSTGAITTTSSFDYKSKNSYVFRIWATAEINITGVNVRVTVTEVDEAQAALAPAPTGLTVTTPSAGALQISWTAPVMPQGIPAITGYRVWWQRNDFNINQYTWGLGRHTKVSASTTSYLVTDLEPGEVHRVFVRALNGSDGERTPFSRASTTGSKRTTIFNGDGSKAYTFRLVAEKSAVVTNIGSPVTATDPQGDGLTYSLTSGGRLFSIDSGTGQLTTKRSFDCIDWNLYGATVAVTDSHPDSHADATRDTIDVTVGITEGSTGIICPWHTYYAGR